MSSLKQILVNGQAFYCLAWALDNKTPKQKKREGSKSFIIHYKRFTDRNNF